MKLLAVHLSGKASETQTFQEKLQMLSQIRGEQLQGTRISALRM